MKLYCLTEEAQIGLMANKMANKEWVAQLAISAMSVGGENMDMPF